MAKILIVDDDQDLVSISKLLLENAGFTVVTAYSKKEGLNAVNEQKPELILLDVMMEYEDDGIAMAQELRKKGNKTPIIMLTSMGTISGLNFGKDDEMVPVDEFLQKPIDGETLLEKVKKFV